MSARGGVAMASVLKIQKAQQLVGNQLILRNAGVDDAAFIVQLRTHPKKRLYLSPTSTEIAHQVAWLAQYAHAADQAYFIVEEKSGAKVGTVRIYQPFDDSFCFGSWVMQDGVPVTHAVESLLIVYHYALDTLGFNRSTFAVRKANRSVWRFMERFGGVRTGETAVDYLYETQRQTVEASFKRHAALLPVPVKVIHDPVS